jgi:endoglucanase
MGFCPLLWDSSSHYSRTERKIKDPQLAAMFLQYKESTTIVLGDVNADNTVDALDFAQLKKYLLGIDKDINVKNADINEDGVIDALDFAKLKMLLLKIS